jgi:RNA polymerase sigma factor (sigma-70 family)
VAVTASAAELSALRADELFASYSEPLLRYCRRKLGPNEAEDAVQTTFLYATRALQRGVVPECESAWLHTIARNVCRWQRRTAARAPSDASDPFDGPLATEPARENDSDGALEVREALARIPERQRRALVLREMQGLPASEVAATLGLGASETYALLSRARRSFVRAYEVVTGRPALGVHVAPLLLKLKSALAGGAATAVAATTLAGGLAVGVSGAGERSTPNLRATVTPPVASAPASDPQPGERAPIGVTNAALSGAKAATATPLAPEAPRKSAGPSVETPGATEHLAEPVTPQAPAEMPDPRNDAPAPTPAPSPGLPVPKPGEPLPGVPDLGIELPVEPPPLPLPEGAAELVDSVVPPVPDVPLPPLPPVPGAPAPELP